MYTLCQVFAIALSAASAISAALALALAKTEKRWSYSVAVYNNDNCAGLNQLWFSPFEVDVADECFELPNFGASFLRATTNAASIQLGQKPIVETYHVPNLDCHNMPYCSVSMYV